jgi:glycosyltransferase involved in cell wall biosynthesis
MSRLQARAAVRTCEQPARRRQKVALDDVTVIIPVRNASSLLEGCLGAKGLQGVHEVIVVDGLSTDDSLDIAHRYTNTILSDEGRGLPSARMLGVQRATTPWVALVDADVILGEEALSTLLQECVSGDYVALQAGLESTSGSGYWGRALVQHHRFGMSKDWFGVVATIFERSTLLKHGFDPAFLSGEDIELRRRLERSGARIGVSKTTIVEHRFQGDDFSFARDQFLADGHGLGRMVRHRGYRVGFLVALPLAASVRGILLSLLRRQPQWVPYYLAYMAFNYVGMLPELFHYDV